MQIVKIFFSQITCGEERKIFIEKFVFPCYNFLYDQSISAHRHSGF